MERNSRPSFFPPFHNLFLCVCVCFFFSHVVEQVPIFALFVSPPILQIMSTPFTSEGVMLSSEDVENLRSSQRYASIVHIALSVSGGCLSILVLVLLALEYNEKARRALTIACAVFAIIFLIVLVLNIFTGAHRNVRRAHQQLLGPDAAAAMQHE
jgi:hypothetical protein